MSLKNSNSKGHDNLSVNAVKNCSNEFARPLTMIFNQSISDGVVPDDLKIAKIVRYPSTNHMIKKLFQINRLQ